MPDASAVEIRRLAARFDAVASQAEQGDARAMQVVQRLVGALPEFFDVYGDVAVAAEDALIDLYAGRSVVTHEATRSKLRRLRTSLAGPTASPLEQLLAERVVVCWLQSYQADLAYAKALEELLPPQLLELYQRRQDRAARQYLKAMRTLADVRRLLIPLVQLNIAENQMNVAVQTTATSGAPSSDPKEWTPTTRPVTSPRRPDRPRAGRRHTVEPAVADPAVATDRA